MLNRSLQTEAEPAVPEPVAPPVRGQRILVAEDSAVTQDLLRLVLNQRGHEVEVVADGEQALAALQQSDYDVVLMDFHLPKMDGLEVTAAFRAGRDQADAPRFVAITADVKGLLSHATNCETFDGVVPKPFDLDDVFRVIEGEEETAVAADPVVTMSSAETEADTGPLPSPRVPDNEPSLLESLGHAFLHWPDDFTSEHLSARALQASLADGNFDAILVRKPASVEELACIWRTKGLHLLPIIDLTGRLGAQADLDASKLWHGEAEKVGRLIESFHERRARLHKDLLYSDDLSDKLLGRIFLTGTGLEAFHDARSKGLVSYNAALASDVIEREAAELLKSGFLSSQFFDRLHTCDRCGSSRFNVREECPQCRSPELSEESYLHHFRCAYQGPESDFRQGDDLVCPKCRQELSHFSVDYDKPGAMVMCGSCGHATSEPSVGLVCVDCGGHADGDAVRTRDVHSYALTDRARAYLETGRALLGHKRGALRFAELPLDLIVALNGELKRYEEQGTPFALLDIAYQNAREIELGEGVRQFDKARELFLENLRNGVRKQDRVVRGQTCDFALMTDAKPHDVRAGLNELREEATNALRIDLGVAFEVYGPEDFA